MQSREWREKREQRLEVDRFTCQSCGDSATEVDHLTYVRFQHERITDLQSLCTDCHRARSRVFA